MEFLNQCTAVITGASSGLGAEFARQLAPYAAELILVARREDRLRELACELERPGLKIITKKVDLANADEVAAFEEWILNSGLRVNFLINNAGLGDYGRFADGPWERIQRMLDVNITALTRLTHAMLPMLKAEKRSAILNVASVAGMTPLPKMAVYAATKSYVISFSEALRAELRGSGVRVTVLCPGPVSTEFGSVALRPMNGEPVVAPEIFKVPAEKVVAKALSAVERDCARVIPGWFVAFVMLLTAAMPMFIIRLAMRGQAK